MHPAWHSQGASDDFSAGSADEGGITPIDPDWPDPAAAAVPVGVCASPDDPPAAAAHSADAATHLTIDAIYDTSVTSLRTSNPALYQDYISAVQTAVQFYENEIISPLTITIAFGWGEINGELLTGSEVSESESTGYNFTYPQLYAAVQATDITSSIQQQAAALLPATDPTGGASFYVSDANMAALNLDTLNGVTEGYVGLSSFYNYSWSQSDIANGTHDAVGALEHEISEDLGRTDNLPPNAYTLLSMFRYTAANGLATDAPGSQAGALDEPFVPGYSANAFSYFSYNGKTITLLYDTPAEVAAGDDIADWADTVTGDSYGFNEAGVVSRVSMTDLEELDVLGYDVVPGALPPAVASVAASPATGDIDTGTVLTLTVTMSDAVTVSGGTPGLTLNDGGTATYVPALSTPTSLVFADTVTAAQRTRGLAIAEFAANGATIEDSNGNAADFSGVLLGFANLMVNIVIPEVVSVTASPASGDLLTGDIVTLTATMSTPVTVTGGAPNVTMNDGGVATYNATQSGGDTLVFDYTVKAQQTATALAVTGYNTNNASITDSLSDTASLAGALTSFPGLEVNIDTSLAASVTAAYQAILRVAPPGAALDAAVSQIAAGGLSLSQLDTSLITGEQALFTTIAALVTIDAYYGATPSSGLLTTVAAATSGTSYASALELHNLGYSDTNVWTVMASGWGADPGSMFYAAYDKDATGTTAGYTAFINAVYAREFGAAPTAANLQNLLADVPGTQALLNGGETVASPIQVMAGLYGYLLEVGQTNGIGQYASATTAFLQAAANGTVGYGPELTQEFPSAAGAVDHSAASNVITVTGSDQLVDPGTGDYTIQFLAGSTGDTLVLHAGGTDQITGFDSGTDVLDLRSLLSETSPNLTGYLTVVDRGADALLNFDASGLGGGTTVAVLQGLASTVTGLDALVVNGTLRVV
jgi:hypothetical protein